MSVPAKIRCAIYTRKSSEEGLEQDFNSLDAQAEACAAFIASQKHEGWTLSPARYDDGGISGGTLERPGLQRLLADIDAGKIDRVVVYKVDRLSRSLTDFSKLVERFDAAGCSFVSVTQSFNTATSMGRLTLNMLLSFAQFEREVTAERIRDKIAASKKKGMWMGGLTPLGYEAAGRTLVVHAPEAATVRTIFDLYDRLGNVRAVKAEADRLGLITKRRAYLCGKTTGGVPFSRGRIYHLLSNPIYIGRIQHRQESYEGQHAAIIGHELWDRVQQKLSAHASRARRQETTASPSPLAGKFTDETDDLLTPSHAVKKGRRYRYYISRRLIAQSGEETIEGWRLPARLLEEAVAEVIRTHLGEMAMPAQLLLNANASGVAALRTSLKGLTRELGGDRASPLLTDLVASGRIEPGRLSISIDPTMLAQNLDVPADRLNASALTVTSGFTLRRRGVETRLILDDGTPQIDKTLLRNLARAHAWFGEIKQGTTIRTIAERERTTRNRVAATLNLAFLAPDIVQSIMEGRQPVDVTSERLVKSTLPILWSDQRTTLK